MTIGLIDREGTPTLRVADLFCGPGGMSTGLGLAGLRTVYGLDKVGAPVDTFAANHPRAIVVRGDAAGLDIFTIPEFDVLVGGPPCVNFSTSKGSRGNVIEGLRLVHVFLRAVYERRPKYWIMENVPRIARHLPEAIPLRWIGIDREGELHVPVRAEFNTADFGVPQTRRRYLIGNYPMPDPTHADVHADALFAASQGTPGWVTLGDIIGAFPSPMGPGRPDHIDDPHYGFSLPVSQLTDHFYDTEMTEGEARRIRDAKTDHPYMGRMPFPDDLDRPSRTVVATQLGRETLVLEKEGSNGRRFRRPTVRECATLQSFPITYQFHGGSLASRYRQAGDAVPPRLSYAIGKAILALEGMPVPKAPIVVKTVVNPAPPVPVPPGRKDATILPWAKKYRQSIPGKEVRGCRADFDNQGEPGHAILMAEGCRNVVSWAARLHVGEGRGKMQQRAFSPHEAMVLLSGFCRDNDSIKRFQGFVADLEGTIPKLAADATTLQAVLTGRHTGAPHPSEVGDAVSKVVNAWFPARRFGRHKIVPPDGFGIVPPRGILVRIAAGLAGAAYACEFINDGVAWVMDNEGSRFVLDDWRPAESTAP